MTKLATTLQSECNETLELVRIHRAIFDLLGRYKRGRTFNQLVAAIKADPADVAIVLRRLRTNEHLTTTLRPVRNGEYSSHYIQNSPDPERSACVCPTCGETYDGDGRELCVECTECAG